jgi:hypothetical protein
MGNGTLPYGDQNRERMCKICGDRFVTGYFEGREICLRCERITIEKAKADRVIE